MVMMGFIFTPFLPDKRSASEVTHRHMKVQEAICIPQGPAEPNVELVFLWVLLKVKDARWPVVTG